MTYKLSLIFALTFLVARSHAQEAEPSKLRAQRIGYITSSLELTPSESQDFWPIFNEFENKVRIEKTRIVHLLKDNSTGQQADRLASYLSSEETILELKKEYVARFEELLGPDRTLLLLLSVQDFKRTVLRKYRSRQ